MVDIFNLVGKRKTPSLTPKAVGVKSGEELERVKLKKLEKEYIMDPVLFNGINVYVKMVLSIRPKIQCLTSRNSEDINKRDQDIIEEFRKRTRFDTIVLPSMVQHMCVYGKSWLEKVYNDPKKNNGKKVIVKLDPMDPKFMDFRREDVSKRIIWDEFGEPKSYVEYLKFNIPSQPNEIQQHGKRAIEFPKDKIVYTPLYTVGDSWDGIGLIEPAYNSARRKFETLQGIAHSLKRLGFPLVGLEVGTESVLPTQEMIDKAAEEFKNLDEKSIVSYPYYVKPKIIESKGIEKIKGHANLFTEEEISSLGLPRPLVMGSGESTNRSTLQMQMILVFQTMSMIQNRIKISLEDQVFKEIAEEYNFDSTPVIEWPDLTTKFMKRSKKVGNFLPEDKTSPNKKEISPQKEE